MSELENVSISTEGTRLGGTTGGWEKKSPGVQAANASLLCSASVWATYS